MKQHAVFLDRDDTLMVNVPYLGDPTLVEIFSEAAAALYTLSPLTLRAVHHDLALPLGALLLVAALDLLLRAPARIAASASPSA